MEFIEKTADHGLNGVFRHAADAFSRLDESDDKIFYQRDRFVDHLDSVALTTVEKLIGALIETKDAVILDLMAGWNSHLPADLQPKEVVGMGLNENELSRNQALDRFVLHDLNVLPKLPFADDTFHAVVNVVSVDYMTRPYDVFREVGRILKPGGLFLVIFSNRMFPQKATQIWRQSSERERVLLVEDFFAYTSVFEVPEVFVSQGKPRPKDDKYAHLGIPSDPIYAVYATKKTEDAVPRKRPDLSFSTVDMPSTDHVHSRMTLVKHTLECPYCTEKMRKWAVPNTPFTTWDNEFMYICFNDACPYLVRGWEVMNRQGNRGISYRLMYDPKRDTCQPVPVPSLAALKDGILE